jgi:biotin-(acetyl-CoA carboxylase) ligase
MSRPAFVAPSSANLQSVERARINRAFDSRRRALVAADMAARRRAALRDAALIAALVGVAVYAVALSLI